MKRLIASVAAGVMAMSAMPAAAIRVPEPAAREASAAELMSGSAVAANEDRDTAFEAAIADYHAGTGWIGLPALDPSSFVAGFLKGALLLAALCAITQRHLFLRLGSRRS